MLSKKPIIAITMLNIKIGLNENECDFGSKCNKITNLDYREREYEQEREDWC